MKIKDEKHQKPRYGYYGLPKFSILIVVIIFIGVSVTIFSWQLLGMLIICFSIHAFKSGLRWVCGCYYPRRLGSNF